MHTGSDVNITLKLGLDNLPILFVVIFVAYYENNYGYFSTCETIETFSLNGYYVMGMGDLVIGLTQCLLTILLTCSFIIFHILNFISEADYLQIIFTHILSRSCFFFSTPDLIHSFLAGEIRLAKIEDSDSFSWNRTNKIEITRGLKSFSWHFLVSTSQFET